MTGKRQQALKRVPATPLSKILADKRLIFCTGKGGTGKTSFAAALAMRQAARGLRVLYVEHSQVPQAADLFAITDHGHEPVHIIPGLDFLNINPQECMREYVTDYLGKPRLYEKVFNHKTVSAFLDMIPGLAEVMILGKIQYSLKVRCEYDQVIFDAPASGHYINLVTTPNAALMTELTGPLIKQIDQIQAFLTDTTECCSLLVTVPESLIMTETFEMVEQIRQTGVAPLAAICINRAADASDAPDAVPEVLGGYIAEVRKRKLLNQKAIFDFCQKHGIDHFSIADRGSLGKDRHSSMYQRYATSVANL